MKESDQYKFKVYFSRKNIEKGIIENLSSSKVQLSEGIMNLKEEKIVL